MGRRLHAFVLVLVLGLVLGLVPFAAGAAPDGRQIRASQTLARLVETYWQEHLRLRPLHATMLGDHRFDGELPDSLSSAQLGREYALEKRSLAALLALDGGALAPRDRISYDAFRWERELEIEGYRYPAELMPIAPSGGLPSLMAQFGSGTGAQPFATVRDYDNWLRRLDAYVIWLDRAVVSLRRGLSRGYVLPRVVVARMLPPLGAIADAPVDESLFMRPVQAFPAGMPAAEQGRLHRAYREAIAARVIPAYRRLYEFLQRDYLPRARASVSWGDLPQGRAWYAYRVRRATTSSLTPDEIHRLGLDEVRRVGAEADRLAADLGLRGDRHANLEALRTDGRAYFERDDDVLAAIAAIKARVRARLPELIDPSPRADFAVQALDAAHAAGAAGLTFRAGSADGTRPAALFLNAAELRTRPRYELDAAYLREVEPGRVLELSMLQDARGLPKFRRYGGYLAFAEGWGLYAEGLGRELGFYGDATSQFAALTTEVLRAARVVVDTGVHSQGWSRDRATEYLVANTALATAEASAEVDRVIGNPTQVLGYEVGAIRLRAMRARAAQALGSRFDLRAFHRQLLANGPLPLDVADRQVDRWLVSQGAAP
jgi:uncharacterized protein (DUF885 family)